MSAAQSPTTPSSESPIPAAEGLAAPAAEPPAGAQSTSTPVAAAVGLLDTLHERPLAEHPDVYQRIHAKLQGALADIDDA